MRTLEEQDPPHNVPRGDDEEKIIQLLDHPTVFSFPDVYQVHHSTVI